jgi:hypothetical protein
MHAATPLKVLNRLADLAVGKMLDGLSQSRVFLANDFVEVRRVHPGFLKLLERSSCLHSLVLARVTHEYHPVLFLQLVYEFIDLPCAREAGFVHNVQVPLRVVSVRSGKMALQSTRMDACFFKLVGGAGSRR